MKYAFIYPGQGSQALGMGKEFSDNFAIAKELKDRASEALGLNMDTLLTQDETKLNQTEYTQPAIFLVSAMAHYILAQESDIKADIAFGHSLGEVSAYCLNGGASFEDSILLTHKRGKFMAQACEGQDVGMLVSLGLKAEILESICKEAQDSGLKVWAANYNLEEQIVLAGIKNDLLSISEQLKNAGAKRTLLLKMSVASHCPLLEGAIAPFRELLEKSICDCSISIISNATTEFYSQKTLALQNLTDQLIKPVLYTKNVQKAQEHGIEKFIELGNGSVLAGLNNKLTNIPTISLNSIQSLKQLGQ